jgi:hypothetical protein
MLAISLLIASVPLDLEAITLPQAKRLDGQIVTVTFLIGKPTHFYQREFITTTGTDDTPDGIERTAIFRGHRFIPREGQRIEVTGTLRVIEHQARPVGKVVLPPWTEIRVEVSR